MASVDDAAADAPVTIFDIQRAEDRRVRLAGLPSLIRRSLAVLWQAGRRELIASVGLQLVGGLGVAGLLVLGTGALDGLLAAERGETGLAAVVPEAGALAAVLLLMLVAGAVQREQQQILGELVSRHVQDEILDVTSVVELAAFDHPSFHNRVQRLQANQHQTLNMVFGLSGLISAVVGVVGVLVALVSIEPILVPLIVVVIAPAALVASRRGQEFWRFFWRMTPRDRERQYLAGLLGGRDAAKEVRAFTLGGYLRDRHRRLFDERIAELRKVARRQLLYTLVTSVVVATMLGAMVVLVAWLALTGRVTLSEAGIAVAGIGVVGARLTGAGFAIGALSESTLYLDDYFSFLAETEHAPPGTSPPPPAGPFAGVAAEGVVFTYAGADHPVLDGVSIEVVPGEVVALVGENGSGKTTLAKVLAGLYRPDSGRVTWSGVDLATVDPARRRAGVAVIFQDFLHYHLLARDNVGLGRHEWLDDLDRIRAAAHQAGADEPIDDLPSGYDTMLGPEFEGGSDLSVGQWQRVALARAFFRDAPFVILDEPTAALDPRAEHELFERIRTLLAGRTVLLISHRFSSVRSADRIYVLDHGRVIEHGTHQALVDHRGRYAELFSLQAGAYQDS
jgi:ATP-binding cassette subfamily B protein